MNSRELIDQMNHDQQRERTPSAPALILTATTIAAALYCAAVFLFTL
jgi:hypothetical protein